jgi:hypothetical protein
MPISAPQLALYCQTPLVESLGDQPLGSRSPALTLKRSVHMMMTASEISSLDHRLTNFKMVEWLRFK